MAKNLVVTAHSSINSLTEIEKEEIAEVKTKITRNIRELGSDYINIGTLKEGLFHEIGDASQRKWVMIICFVRGNGNGRVFLDSNQSGQQHFAYQQQQHCSDLPMEFFITQLNSVESMKKCIRFLFILDLCPGSGKAKAMYCNPCKNTIVFEVSTQQSTKNGSYSTNVLIDVVLDQFVNLEKDTKVFDMVQRIQNSYTRSMSDAQEYCVPYEIFPMQRDFVISCNPRASSTEKMSQTPELFTWRDKTGQLYNRGMCFIFHDLEHTKLAASLESGLKNLCIMTEQHSVAFLTDVLHKVSENINLYDDCGVIIIAVLCRHYKTTEGYLCLDEGKSFRFSSDIFNTLCGLNDILTIKIILDCEFEKVEPNVDQVSRSDHSITKQRTLEFCAKGKNLTEHLIKELTSGNSSIQEIFVETMNKFNQDDSFLFSTVNQLVRLKDCKKIELPATLQVTKENGKLPVLLEVELISEQIITERGRWLLNGPMGAGKTVACRQIARYLTTHMPRHQVVYVNEEFLLKLCLSDGPVAVNKFFEFVAENEEDLARLRQNLEEKRLVVMLDGVHMVINEHESKLLRYISALAGIDIVLWIATRTVEEEKILKCLGQAVDVKMNLMSKEAQVKILSAKLMQSEREIFSALQTHSKISLEIPLYLEMIHDIGDLVKTEFAFIQSYVENKIFTEDQRINSQSCEEMRRSIMHTLLHACVKTSEGHKNHTNFEVFKEQKINFNKSFASFFVALNSLCTMGLVDGVLGCMVVENIFSQHDLAQERAFIEMKLSESVDLQADFAKIVSSLDIDSLKRKVHDCVFNIVSEGCSRLGELLFSPKMRQMLEIDNLIEPESHFLQLWKEKYQQHSPLFYAMRSNEKVALALLQACPFRDSLLNIDFYAHEAAKNGFVEVTKIIAAKCPSAINEFDSKGYTPFHYATYFNRTEWIRTALLMGFSASVGLPSKSGISPIFYAAGNGNVDVLRFLVMHGANTKAQDFQGSSALHWILETMNQNDLGMLQFFLTQGLVDVNYRNTKGETAVMIAAGRKLYVALELLIAAGADLNCIDVEGSTMWHLMAQTGNIQACQKVMPKLDKMLINIKNVFGKTALHYAVEKMGLIDVVRFLLENGADVAAVDGNGRNALHIAVSRNPECIEILIDRDSAGYLYSFDVNGETPLHLAAKCAGIKALRILISKGASYQPVVGSEKTILECALITRNARAAKFLSAIHGVDVNSALANLNFESLEKNDAVIKDVDFKDVEPDGALPGPSGMNDNAMQDGHFEGMEVDDDESDDETPAETTNRKSLERPYFKHEHLTNLNLKLALHRFFTFPRDFDERYPVKRLDLAQSGFYCTEENKSMQCHYCFLIVDFVDMDWVNMNQEQINLKHASLSKRQFRRTCKLMRGDETEDVPIVNPSNYIFESHRLYSLLAARWPNPHISVYDLAKYGFYYTGQDDNCRCIFCKLEVRGWEPGDTAEVEHRRWNPRCPFLQSNSQTENVPIGKELDTRPLSDHLRNPFVKTQISEFGPHVKLCRNVKMTTSVEALGITPIGDMKYRQYSTVQSREKSFRSWPRQLAQQPDVLCAAGFFYTGSGDRVICFQCGGGLKDWDPKDDPWVEHAKWFSRCPYLSIKRGKKFIDDIIHTNEEPAAVATDGLITLRQSDTPGSLECWVCKRTDVNCVSLACGHMTTCITCVENEPNCRACDQPRVAFAEVFL